MKTIKVWVYGRQNPIIFEDIEEYSETLKALVIIQEEMYQTIATKIFKQSIQMYEITEVR